MNKITTIKLWKSINHILWNNWDPIGINDSGPNDEYRGYVPAIVKLLIVNADVKEIATQLHLFAYEDMGLDSTLEANMDVAQKLHELIQSQDF